MGHHLVGVYHGIPNNKTPDVDGSLLNVAGSTWLNLQPLVVSTIYLQAPSGFVSGALRSSLATSAFTMYSKSSPSVSSGSFFFPSLPCGACSRANSCSIILGGKDQLVCRKLTGAVYPSNNKAKKQDIKTISLPFPLPFNNLRHNNP